MNIDSDNLYPVYPPSTIYRASGNGLPRRSKPNFALYTEKRVFALRLHYLEFGAWFVERLVAVQELYHEDGEVLEAVGVDRHRHRLDRGRGPQLDLTRGSTQSGTS